MVNRKDRSAAPPQPKEKARDTECTEIRAEFTEGSSDSVASVPPQ